ncbi:MFS transporter [Agromyces marinus]|uniref:MFS transporter n=1 Tax=Agromyces marinus TaxID=1389020 RepID=A0ABM8GXB4_9MICO|nr:MFS transporter [Agromyces marinus]UIP58608.1 putative MFS-type transporter YfcJ [Agromyces marinus]BDZ53109.1 MFS transporter [Agromyces marinus]
MTGDAREPLFTRAFIALGVAELAYFSAAGLALFALPLYVTGPVGGNEAAAGLSVGVFAVSALVLRPFAGRATDRYGRRPLLLGGAIVAALCLLLLAVTDDLWVIIALRLGAGVAEAAFFVAGFAALADLAPPSRMGEALSYNSLGLYLGIALGPVLGQVLYDLAGFRAAWLGGAVLATVAAGLSVIVGETRTTRPIRGAPLRIVHRPAIAPSIGFLTSLVAVGGFVAFATLYADRVGFAAPSTALVTYGVIVVVCRVAFARVVDRVRPLPLAVGALVTIGAGLLVAAAWQDRWGLIAGVAVMAVGITFSTPAFFAAVFATAAPEERGIASGTASAAVDLGLGIGPILLGFVAAPFGIPWAFALAAGIAFAGAAWTGGLVRRSARAAPA